jgi:hypothetical protein
VTTSPSRRHRLTVDSSYCKVVLTLWHVGGLQDSLSSQGHTCCGRLLRQSQRVIASVAADRRVGRSVLLRRSQRIIASVAADRPVTCSVSLSHFITVVWAYWAHCSLLQPSAGCYSPLQPTQPTGCAAHFLLQPTAAHCSPLQPTQPTGCAAHSLLQPIAVYYSLRQPAYWVRTTAHTILQYGNSSIVWEYGGRRRSGQLEPTTAHAAYGSLLQPAVG